MGLPHGRGERITNMQIKRDGKGQMMIEWEQTPAGAKRAWIQHRTGTEDWANTGRYILVARTPGLGHGPAPGPDFPVHHDLPDDQALIAFVAAVCGVTGGNMPA